MHARLSFVIPTYKPNLELFEKHLKAMVGQALESWEAIYVLDGENKEAEKLILKHRGDKEITIKKIEHSGAQTARNEGGKLAMGDFLCFFDSDCIIEPGASKMWVEQFDKKPEVGFIYSGYKFLDNKYALDSEPYDPYTLRVRNYISGCFPMRKELYPGWTDGLKSLQDWDMWLSLLEKAKDLGWDIDKLGLFIRGYAFATSYPDADSISGQGCKPENWLDRMDAVKKLHGLPDRDVCVSSLQYPMDGLALAKLLEADYQDVPNDKPHKYKTIVQIGFSLGAGVEKHAQIFQDKEVKKFLFWTSDNISEMYHGVSFQQIDAISTLLNDMTTQYAEDKEAVRLLKRAGFNASVFAMPIGKATAIEPAKEKKWAVDCSGKYSPLISTIARSLPDMSLDMIGAVSSLKDYKGLIHFFPDRTMSSSIKRALLTGRHVISNVQQPFCGFIDDKFDVEKFVVEAVDKIRELSNTPPDVDAANYYSNSADKLKEVLA